MVGIVLGTGAEGLYGHLLPAGDGERGQEWGPGVYEGGQVEVGAGRGVEGARRAVCAQGRDPCPVASCTVTVLPASCSVSQQSPVKNAPSLLPISLSAHLW